MNLLSAAWRREGRATFWRARRMKGFKKELDSFTGVDPLLIKS